MNENQVSSILAKYGVKRTGTGGAKALPAPVSMPAKEVGEQKNAILAKYGVTPSREGDIRAQAEKRTGQTTAEALLSHPSPAQGRAMLGVREPVRLPERKITPISLPTPQGRDEEETLRQESRLRTQLAKGVAPETLGARQELREQRLQNLPAEELKARQEQALGHLEEAKEAMERRARETHTTSPYSRPWTEEDKALQGELDKWQGIVNGLAGRYYYRENEEKAAALAGDRAGQSRVQAVEDILADLRTLGEVAAGQYGDQRDREELMAKYGLSERELETQAPALIGRLQGELERAKEEAKAAGYDYDRMTGYQERKGQTARAIEGQKHTEEFAREHPALASAASILTSPVQGVDYFTQLAKGYGHSDPAKLESYVPANVYEMRATNFVRNVRGTVARDLEEKYGWSIGDQNVASFLYQTGMSMGDFLFNAMLTGNFSGGLGGAGTQAAQKAASDLSLAIMGSGAAANTTAEAIERGLNNQQAFTLGAIAGVAEIITEKVSLETLLDKTALDRSARGYLLKNILAEGSEEVASDLINWAGDVLVAKDQSQWSQAIREYEAQGMGEKEAFELALKDQLISMAWSGLGGGLSGGVMAGGRIAINSAIDSYQNRGAQAGTEVSQAEKTAPMEGAAKIDPGARRPIREQIAEMPSEDYQIPHISMPQEALVWEDGGNVPESKMPSVIRRYMSKLFKGKVLNVGKDHTVYIDKGGIEEYAFPAKRISGEIRAAKMTAGANLDTTLEPAQFLKNGADDGHHPEAKGGWDYFYVMFETDTGIYSGIVNTKITDRGRVFHDITEIQKESGPSTRGVNGETPPPAKTVPLSSDSIIPRAGDGVNREYAAGGAEYTEKPEVKRLPVAEKPEVKRLPKVEKAEAKDGDWESLAAQADALFPVPPEMDEANWDSLMRSDTGLGARREAAAKPQAQKADPVGGAVRANTSLFDRAVLKNFNTARKWLIEYAKEKFPAQVVNAETGKTIGISRTGLDKFLSGNIPFEKYASGFHIPELIEQAHKVSEAANYHQSTAESIPTFEYFDSPIEIDGRMYNAHIRVKNTLIGDKYYGHTVSEIEDIKIEHPTRTSVPAKPAVQPENTGRSTSDPIIPQTGDGVNREYAEGGTEYTGKKENPFIQTGTQGEFVDDRTAREKAMVEEAQRRRAAQPDAAPTYRMTAAMEKLGMEAPTRPITDAGMSESLRASSRAHYEAKRALDKVLRDTHADERARRWAKNIVDGIETFESAEKAGLDRRAMTDIVEAMELERSFSGKNIKAHQERTNWVFDGKVQELIRDAGNWKAPSLVSMNASTMQRTVERMMDPATARAVNGEFFDPVLENEAKRIRFANNQLDKIRGYNLTAKESAAVQRLMEGKVTADELRGEGYDVPRLEKAAKVMTEMYATFYDAINDFLVAHGYEEIGWQKNYAPHMQEENLTKLQKYLQRLGFSAEVTELPTEIAGRTDAFRPGKQFDPFFQHRAGGEGDIKYDAMGGLESYINYMSNVLYHTDDIQKLRRLSEGIRSKFAEGYLREELDQLNDLQDQIVAGKDVKESWEGVQARKDKLYEELDKKTKLGGFVSVLDDYTNILAGKQSKVDRAIESFAERRVLNWGRNIQNAFARSAVMGNLSSAINQTVQLPQLTAEVGPKYVLQAITDVAGGKVGDFCKESTFLTGKQGVQAVSALEGMEVLYDKLSIPFEVVDDLASRIIVRAKYLQQVDQGMDHAAALEAADQYANRLVGSRMKGAKPIVFEQKNPITKLVTTFQLEVANGWEHIVHDLPMEIKETARTQGKAAAVGKTVKLAVAAELAAFIGNLLIKGITGREPVPFDGLGMLANYMASGYGMTKEDYMKAALTGEEMPEEFDVPAALDDAAEGVVDNVPYLSNITTLLGITDGRLPLPQIETEKLGGAAKDALTAIFSKDEEEREEAAPRILPQAVGGIAGTAASFLPAGNQLKKTFRALPVLRRGGAYTGDGEEKLKYPVEQSPVNIAKGLMFGTSALPETDAYYAEGKKTLSVKETRVYETLVEAGSDGQKVYDAMQELKGAKERKGKIDELLKFEGTRAEKEALFSGMVTQTLDEELGELEKLEIPFDTVLEAYKAQYGLEGDKDPKTGETVPLSLAKKKKAAVDRVLSGLTRKQREAVYKAMGISEKVWNEPRLPPRRK